MFNLPIKMQNSYNTYNPKITVFDVLSNYCVYD